MVRDGGVIITARIMLDTGQGDSGGEDDDGDDDDDDAGKWRPLWSEM